MRIGVDGIPRILLALGLIGISFLMTNASVTKIHPAYHVYQVQLLGHIMLVCPETFSRSSGKIDCERWLRRTRGGTTVFVQPYLPEMAPEGSVGSIKPRARPSSI
jgi:hypothetical protein